MLGLQWVRENISVESGERERERPHPYPLRISGSAGCATTRCCLRAAIVPQRTAHPPTWQRKGCWGTRTSLCECIAWYLIPFRFLYLLPHPVCVCMYVCVCVCACVVCVKGKNHAPLECGDDLQDLLKAKPLSRNRHHHRPRRRHRTAHTQHKPVYPSHATQPWERRTTRSRLSCSPHHTNLGEGHPH